MTLMLELLKHVASGLVKLHRNTKQMLKFFENHCHICHFSQLPWDDSPIQSVPKG